MSAAQPPLRPHPAALPLAGPEDALSVVLSAASQPARDEAVCLLLDHAHRGLGCLVIVGRGPASELGEVLMELAAQEPAVAGVVLASIRPRAGHGPGRPDVLAFHDLRERLDELAVDLVDWFVITGRKAASLAELTDSQVRWRPR